MANTPLNPSNLPRSIQLGDREFQDVRKLVYSQCGIQLNESKRELVVARLSKRIRQLGMQSVGDYLTYIREQKTQDELVSMLDAISTNLTSFWRESEHFNYLVKNVLPNVISRGNNAGRRVIRAWSAGCSTGEEPYGMAMLLHDAVSGEKRWDMQILATDLSTRVLNVAQQGRYPEERVKNIPPDMRNRYMTAEKDVGGKYFTVNAPIRSMVKFGRLNLMESWPMRGPFDFIFCRNVMIYFDKSTQAELVRRFYDLLCPGGTLFVGHSESLTGIQHTFRYVQPTVYERP